MTRTYDFFCDNGGEVIIPVAQFERDCEYVELFTGTSGAAYVLNNDGSVDYVTPSAQS